MRRVRGATVRAHAAPARVAAPRRAPRVGRYHLHDDFYDDDGTAVQPEEDVEDAERHAFPSRGEWAGSPALALDVALARWHLDDDIVTVLASTPDETLSGLARVATLRNEQLEARALEIAARALGPRAAAWVHDRWRAHVQTSLLALAEASAACLPAGEGLDRVLDALDRVPAALARDELHALAFFPGPEALRALEGRFAEPVTESYGRIAACCGVSWPVIERWLAAGRPSSLVAIDALEAIAARDTPLLRRLTPVLAMPPTRERFESTLREHQQRDPAPRVARDIALVLAEADRILGAAR